MEHIKHGLLTGLYTLVCSISLAFPLGTGASSVKSGADCNAANLQQALEGISNSQLGIVNNANRSLYVVCSVDYDENELNQFFDVEVEGIFPQEGGSIPCIFRAGNYGASGFASASFTIRSGFVYLNPNEVSSNRGYNSVNADQEGLVAILLEQAAGGHSVTMVCALDPGEGIGGLESGPVS